MTRNFQPCRPRCQQVMSFILNEVAFGTDVAVGNIDSLAEELNSTNQRGDVRGNVRL
jgi:hypothetical protein